MGDVPLDDIRIVAIGYCCRTGRVQRRGKAGKVRLEERSGVSISALLVNAVSIDNQDTSERPYKIRVTPKKSAVGIWSYGAAYHVGRYMQAMQKLIRLISETGIVAAGLCAAASLFGIMILMVCDVFGRYLFNRPIPGAAEMIQLAMGIVVFAALPLVTIRREHVALDYFEVLLSDRTGYIVRAVIDLVTAAILGFLAWRIAVKAATYIRYGDTTPYLNIPVAPLAVFIAVATGVSALALIISAVRTLVAGPISQEPN